jgi:DNA (cytosine-5)-methyltransferase 1
VPPGPVKPARSVELFSGIGGFRFAGDSLGIETVWANDADSAATSVYRERWGEGALAEGWLEDRLHDIPDHDVLTAGFPCQPFSSAGKKRGDADPRSYAVVALLRVVAERRPKVLVLENVPFLLSARRGEAFRSILGQLSALGYVTEWRIVNAADFGLPQYRQRLIAVASTEWSAPRLQIGMEEPELRVVKQENRLPPWGLHTGGQLQEIVSERRSDWGSLALADWIDEQVPEEYDFTSQTYERLPASRYIGRRIRGVEVLYNQNGGSRMGYTVYGISALAPTLTATTSRHFERFRVGDRFRRLAPWEYLRLQGFPDDHADGVPKAVRYRLAGNAIPPPVAAWALRCALGLDDLDPTAGDLTAGRVPG